MASKLKSIYSKFTAGKTTSNGSKEINGNIPFGELDEYSCMTSRFQDRYEMELAQQKFNTCNKELDKVKETVHELTAKCLQLESSQKEAIHAQKLAEEKLNYYQTELDETKNSNYNLTEKCLQLENSLAEIEQKYASDMEQLSTSIKQGNNGKEEDNLKIDIGNQIMEMKRDLQACEKELLESKCEILEYEQKCQYHELNIEKQSKKIQSHQIQITQYRASLEQQESQHLDDVKKLLNELKEARTSLIMLSTEVKELKKKNVSAEKELDTNKKISLENNKKIAELTNRLSEEWSNKLKLSANENIENINVRNRPMTVASEYEMICCHEWRQAKTAVDEIGDEISEEDKINFLRSIFELSENEATSHFEMIMIMQNLENMLNQPFKGLPLETSMPRRIPDQVKVFISDELRENSDSMDLTEMVQKVKDKSAINYHHFPSSILADKDVGEFTEVSVKLAWKMALQRPPMYFTQDKLGERWQGKAKEESIRTGSNPDDHPDSKVKYYVHPVLYHGELMMVKGRVYLSEE